MIVCYRDKRTRELAEGKRVKAFAGIERRDLDLPGDWLEMLKGDRKGFYSVRVNNQWRVCFGWPDGSPGPVNVEIVDFH